MSGLVFLLFIVGGVVGIARFLKMNPGILSQFHFRGISCSWLNNGELDVGGQTVKFHYKSPSKKSTSRLQATLTGNFFAHAFFRLENGTDRVVVVRGHVRNTQIL